MKEATKKSDEVDDVSGGKISLTIIHFLRVLKPQDVHIRAWQNYKNEIFQ